MNGTNDTAATPTRPPYALSPDAFTTTLIMDASQLNPHANTVQIIMVLGYAVMSLLCFALILHLRRNRSNARKGDTTAARKILLPTFMPLLWILGLATGFFALAMLTIYALDLFKDGTPRIASEIFYCGRQFVFLLAMVFMLQKSVSLPALGRSIAISLALATYTMPVVVYTSYWGDPTQGDLYFIIQRVLRLVLVAAFLYIFFRPPSRASKSSIRAYCCFTFVYQALSFACSELIQVGHSGAGYATTYCALVWAALVPLVIWRLLLADTEHWRGMGQRACALQNVHRQKHQIQEHISAQGLHVLIEMHRKLIIDFAYLELKHKIGVGASAIVYDGILRSQTAVATKVYTPNALTDEVVANFSHEAALCAALHHPNIVRFYGMCVCPPTIGLVFELCKGSLETMLEANRRSAAYQPNRQTMMIHVGYMIDAARAVAYLHSFSPGFLHRDIKPANFLVDSDHNVKLTDFGESRSISTVTGDVTIAVCDYSVNAGLMAPSPTTVLEVRETAQKMTVKGTVDYMAPELINGKGGFACYGETADVYSLAMTMWDILHPGKARYPDCTNNHLHVFQAVLDGKRPDFAPDVHPALQELICNAWHVDPRMRPSAEIIVSVIQSVQEEISASFLAGSFRGFGYDKILSGSSDEEEIRLACGSRRTNTNDDVCSNGTSSVVPPAIGTFSGVEIVGQLVSHQYVETVGEAVRMGRMWMDAGFLHHVKHTNGFTDDNAQFYVDEDHVRFCRPLADDVRGATTKSLGDHHARLTSAIGRRTHTSSVDSQTSSRASSSDEAKRSTTAAKSTMCACRKHGQRQIETAKPSKRTIFSRKKVQSTAEANLLTTALLVPDEGMTDMSAGSGFSDFTWNAVDGLHIIQE